MSLIEFKDLPDTTTPITADNLNNNFNELKGEVLYNTTGDSATTLTLNDDIENYETFEIVYKIINIDNDVTLGTGSAKGIVGESCLIGAIHNGYYNDISSYAMRLYSARVSISQSTLTKFIGYTFSLKAPNGDVHFQENRNEIFITKVIGYK